MPPLACGRSGGGSPRSGRLPAAAGGQAREPGHRDASRRSLQGQHPWLPALRDRAGPGDLQRREHAELRKEGMHPGQTHCGGRERRLPGALQMDRAELQRATRKSGKRIASSLKFVHDAGQVHRGRASVGKAAAAVSSHFRLGGTWRMEWQVARRCDRAPDVPWGWRLFQHRRSRKGYAYPFFHGDPQQAPLGGELPSKHGDVH
mmetsp:Transcript_5598/g.10025  ORF Transcript_5598/g.10025 Transcript_5598/m.10025 type:complete len:204 (-) Transcript_5598:418-1029(-)